MKIHGKKGRFPCKFCKETFSTKGERKKHQLWIHEEPSKYIFDCSNCPAKFVSKYSTSKHISTVQEEIKKSHPSSISVNTGVATNISQSSPKPSFDPMYSKTHISTVHEEKKKNHYSQALLNRCLIHDASNPFDSSSCLFQDNIKT